MDASSFELNKSSAENLNSSISKSKINSIKKERLSIENFQHNLPINLSLNQSDTNNRLDEEDIGFSDSFLNENLKEHAGNVKVSSSNLNTPIVESTESPNITSVSFKIFHILHLIIFNDNFILN